MPDYSKGRVYKILNTVNDKVYVGSTTCALSTRMVQHRSQVDSPRYAAIPFYAAIREIGVEHFYIELIKDFPCKRKEQLTAEEGKCIREMKTMVPDGYNLRVAGRTPAEYYVTNKEGVLARSKANYEANKVAKLQKCAEYRAANHDAIVVKRMAKREENNAKQRAHYYARKDAEPAAPVEPEPAEA